MSKHGQWLGGWCEWCHVEAVLRHETLCDECRPEWDRVKAHMKKDRVDAQMKLLRKMATRGG